MWNWLKRIIVGNPVQPKVETWTIDINGVKITAPKGTNIRYRRRGKRRTGFQDRIAA